MDEAANGWRPSGPAPRGDEPPHTPERVKALWAESLRRLKRAAEREERRRRGE